MKKITVFLSIINLILAIALFYVYNKNQSSHLELYDLALALDEVAIQDFSIYSTGQEITIKSDPHLVFNRPDLQSVSINLIKDGKSFYSYAQSNYSRIDSKDSGSPENSLLYPISLRNNSEILYSVTLYFEDGTHQTIASKYKLKNSLTASYTPEQTN